MLLAKATQAFRNTAKIRQKRLKHRITFFLNYIFIEPRN